MSIVLPKRQVGARTNGEQLDRELAIRRLEAKELARLAGVSEDVVSRARRGQRISLHSLYAIADALEGIPPVSSLVASLTAAPEPVAC